MNFLRRNALVISACVFAMLLVTHTAFVLSHITQEKESFRILAETIKQSNAESTLAPPKVNTITFLQTTLVLLGIPLLFLSLRSLIRARRRLSTITAELENSNSAYIFNSQKNESSHDVEKVKGRLVGNLQKIREFIQAISKGNYGIKWDGMTEENKNANRETIAGELLNMRDQMQLVKEQDQISIWTTEGISKFGEIIRKHQDNFDRLSENLISNVVNYVGAKVGGLFILEEEDGGKSYLQLRATYAFDRKKFITKRIEIGEGIIGQCYLEGQTIYMAKVPNNYLSITSGLGEANPNSLLVIPLRTNERIEGVLELASLKPFKKHEIEFLEKLGELLASSIITVRTSEKTSRLLQISHEQAEEMRAQEEEMRQNMEELEATQEQMNRTVAELATIKASLEKEKYLLDSLMDNIPDAIYFKDRDSRFIRVSKYLASHFSGNVDDLIGKSDFDFQDHSRAQQAYDDEQNIMATRKPKIDYIEKEVMTDGSEHWVSTTKMPLINGKGEVVGTFGISRDVTRLKKLENDVIKRDQSMGDEIKQYEEKIKSLEDKLNVKRAS
jgi:PAS domain S-box-containing protein